MNTISESAYGWRASTEIAMAPGPVPEAGGTLSGDDAVDDGFMLFGNDGFTFLDFLDIINPLHHIPVVGTLYRQMVDDTLDPGSRVIGSTLFFGPVGTVAAVADVLIEDGTGMDIGEHVAAFFDDGTPATPEVAEASPDAPARVVADAGTGGQAVDPVTAWARSEIAYRKSAAEKARTPVVSQAPAGAIGDVAQWTATWAAGTEHALLAAADARPDARTGQPASGVAAMARDARHSQRLFAAATYGMAPPAPTSRDETRDEPRNGTREAARDDDAAPGAVAAGGGWFSGNTLSGLEKYRSGAGLTEAKRPVAIDLRR